jgi:ADP-heptose:LPS heptosyltransferase
MDIVVPNAAAAPQPPAHAGGLAAEAYEANAPFNLGSIAYENFHAPVFHAWLNLDGAGRREALQDRYVFYSVSACVGAHLADLLRLDLDKANAFAGDVMDAVTHLAHGRSAHAEEWFRGLDQLAAAFSDRNYLAEARSVVALGFRTGAVKYPRIAQSLTVHAAYLDALVGRREKAAKVALRLVRRPFLLPSRRELPRVYQKLMYVLSASNHLDAYRFVLWQGASQPHTDAALREAFVGQIVNTYRGALRALLRREVPLPYRLPIPIGQLARVLAESAVARRLRAHLPLRWLHLGSVYLADLLVPRRVRLSGLSPHAAPARAAPSAWLPLKRAPQRILVTRAMGGIGDLLMMTPGLRALSRKWAAARIDFAIPKSFHSLLEGFDAVRLLDINEDEIDVGSYDRWINLTDCPAGRVESRQYPDVRRNRIEIFAAAMGIRRALLAKAGGCLPFYRVSAEEQAWASEHLQALNARRLPVIGVQPFAADTYRNWPYMEPFVGRIAETSLVLLFHHEEVPGYDFPNVVKVVQPLRRSVALAAQCRRLVVLDSSFLHFSAALGIPTVAIFGAISGKLRTGSYPEVRLLAPDKREFPCYPCWRHEHKPCHLTNGRESICFRSITPEQVVAALDSEPERRHGQSSMLARLASWLRYGRA